jgi:lipopolysaccharide heptosyltransferase I
MTSERGRGAGSPAILVVRIGALGDIIHTLPAVAAIRAAYPDARIDWLVEGKHRAILDLVPVIDSIIPIESAHMTGWLEATRRLRGRRYDVALDFQGLWKSAAWARLSGARRVLGWEPAARREPGSARLLRETVTRIGSGHVIDKNLALLAPLGIDALGLREFPLPFSAEAVARVDAGLQGLGDGALAVLNPGGGWPSKLWPAERFGQLARELLGLGMRPLVSFGPGEEDLARRVVAASDGAAQLSFPTTLLDYVELARRARLVVAADTGPLHLACAVGTPVVALFGPTEPGRNGPFSPDDVVVRRVPACAPCYSRSCARHAGVMEGISLEEVRAAVERRLALARA